MRAAEQVLTPDPTHVIIVEKFRYCAPQLLHWLHNALPESPQPAHVRSCVRHVLVVRG